MRKYLLFLIPLALVACSLGSSSVLAQERQSSLYPPIEPSSSGHLRVSDIHEVYWELIGNPQGRLVIVMHGGPGGSASPEMRRYFDPERFHVLLFDQRGGGRSRPFGEWRENTTQDLVADVNRLREHLGLEGKAILFGGSWGSTLALAYAEAHPELVCGMVLRGVFLSRPADIEYFYHGGVAAQFPDTFEFLQSIVPDPESMDYHRQLFEMTQSEDEEVRKKAIEGWAYYEIRISQINSTDEQARQIVEQYSQYLLPFSVLENYYMANGCFFEDNQLIRDIGRIAHLPTFIVNGRFDVVCPPREAWELAKHLQTVELEFTPAGHVASEPANEEALVRGVKWVAEQVDKAR